MGTFPSELDSCYRRCAKELGRDPTQQEGEVLEAELFQAWVAAKRYDELIRRIHAVYDREGGHVECIVLGHALREDRDSERIHILFRGLVKRRVKAFWSNWKLAQDGHPGHMLGCAQQAAHALETYVEYYISLATLGETEQKETLRAEMLAFQARERPTKVNATSGKASNKSLKLKPLRDSA